MRPAIAEALALGASQLDGASDLLSIEEIEAGRNKLLFAIQNVKSDYVINWHHSQLAMALEMVQRGEITRLMVFIPPRGGKSEQVSRHFPAWCLGKNPEEKIMACSYSSTLASDMGMDVQNIMHSDEYQAMFSTRLKSGVEMKKGHKKVKETNLRFDVVGTSGYYIGLGVGGPATGRGFSLGIVDDYCKNRAEAESKAFCDRWWKWYTSSFYSRREGAMSAGGCDRIVFCVTPWGEDTLSGRVLAHAEEMGEKWVVIRFPAVKDSEDAGLYQSSPGFVDPREDGEALWPEKFSLEDLEKTRKLNPSDWTSLYQCRPSAATGNIFKRDDWQLYDELPKDHLVYTFSLDCAFKDGESSSFVVLQLWASHGPDHYLVEQWRGKRDYDDTKELCQAKFKLWPKVHRKLIEDKANGPAIISSMKKKFSGIVPVTPRGSKVARAMSIEGIVKAGNVHLPRHADWREEFVNEHAAFPWGKHDDQVDAMTQYLEYGPQSSMGFLQALTGGMEI